MPIDLDGTDRGRDWIRQPRLTCAECGRRSEDDAPGWRSYLTADGEIGTYCPDCATREFGPTH